jgi:hypothetical protein
MLNAYVTSAIRTGVPLLVGWIVSWLVAKGIGIDDQTRDWLVSFLTFVLSMAYYLIARWLEQKNPKLGFLLGVPVQPVYVAPGATPAAVSSTTDTVTEDVTVTKKAAKPPNSAG